MKKTLLIGIPLLAFLFFIVVIVKKNSFVITTISYNQLTTEFKDKKAYVLYTDILDNGVKTQLRVLYDEYKLETYNADMTKDQINEFIKDSGYEAESELTLILVYNSKIVYVTSMENEVETIFEQFDKYIYGTIPSSERYYKEVSTADEYLKKVNSNDYTVAVFGKESCSYCTLYLPVINKIAKDNNLNIYYFDADNFNEDEYEKITALNYTIPSKCTTTGYETTLSTSFPKPMTIITKKGEFVDCIKGYVTEDEVLDVLREYKIVKEK